MAYKVVTVDDDGKTAFPIGKDLVQTLTNSTISTTAPHYTGQMAVNTQNGLTYIGTGTGAGDWLIQGTVRTISSLSENSLFEGEIVKVGSMYYFSSLADSDAWKPILVADYLAEVGQPSSSYTLAESDHGKIIEMTYAGASSVILPSNSAVPLRIGFQVLIAAGSTFFVTINPDVGVSVKSAGDRLTIVEQHAIASAIKVSTNVWRLTGALVSI